MMIELNESKLETIEQIREFLIGEADVICSIPSNEIQTARLHRDRIRRFRYFSLTKGRHGGLFKAAFAA